MTLVYKQAEVRDNTPGTHALVIGVGAYPHLLGGTDRLAANAFGLGQLSSPPISAIAMLDWCLQPLLGANLGFLNEQKPLATVEALISAAKPISYDGPQGSVSIDRATHDNIKNSFDVWLERLSANSENIGLMYFCGHGVEGINHILLPEDFAKRDSAPWDTAFDITTTMQAVEKEIEGSVFFSLTHVVRFHEM